MAFMMMRIESYSLSLMDQVLAIQTRRFQDSTCRTAAKNPQNTLNDVGLVGLLLSRTKHKSSGFSGTMPKNTNKYGTVDIGSPSSSGLSSSSGCTSDFSCGIGSKCVKEPYDYKGVCMKSVDRYGIQKFTMPSSDSIGLRDNDSGCRFLTDCPIGFECDTNYKVCVKR